MARCGSRQMGTASSDRDPVTGHFQSLADIAGKHVGLERIRSVQIESLRPASGWAVAVSDRRALRHSIAPARALHALRQVCLRALRRSQRARCGLGTDAGLERFDSSARARSAAICRSLNRQSCAPCLQDRGRLALDRQRCRARSPRGRHTPARAVPARRVGNGARSPSDTINALLEDRDGRLWIGTTAGLATLRSASTATSTSTALMRPIPRAFLTTTSSRCSKTATACCGSARSSAAWRSGIRAPGHSVTTPPDRSRVSPAATSWRSPKIASKRLWIGTFDGGIAVVDRATPARTTPRHRPERPEVHSAKTV